ncbi:hypothetical protein B0T21DRAFT_279923 [Apiosordaria backusii]|uniref:Uncharacterized protein n=1 Tax=Apiosordaria backusii TaxID=314023 RepID=A0AA40K3G3_9PEZI|nr:hypothetical protein B0T21DRAFT_279923 [Apiosordaria backusii]
MKVITIIALFLGAVSAHVAALVPAEATTTIALPPAATETAVSWIPETQHNSSVTSGDDKPRWHLEMFESNALVCNDKQWISVRLNQFGTFCFETEVTIRALRVINTGGCSTTMFTDEHCTNNPQHLNDPLKCIAYTNGELIKSIVVAC